MSLVRRLSPLFAVLGLAALAAFSGGAMEGARRGLDACAAVLIPSLFPFFIVSALLRSSGAVHALAHITGGGITENLNRALPDSLDALVDTAAWEVPAVIRLGCEAAGLTDEEARKTFNMGIGMILLVDPAQVDAVTANLREAGEDPVVVGKVVPGTGVVKYAE